MTKMDTEAQFLQDKTLRLDDTSLQFMVSITSQLEWSNECSWFVMSDRKPKSIIDNNHDNDNDNDDKDNDKSGSSEGTKKNPNIN